MGSIFSDEAEPVNWQQQRAQLLLIQQLQDQRMLAEGLQASSLVEPPGVWESKVFMNPAHLHGKTLTFTENTEGLLLNFCFDASDPVDITVHASAALSAGSGGVTGVASATWRSIPQSFGAGLGQNYSVEWRGSEKRAAAPGHTDASACLWPLIVELRVEGGQEQPSASCEWTLCRIKYGSSAAKNHVEMVQQQVGGGALAEQGQEILDVSELYGSEMNADKSRQDCIVCQTEPRDTAVLPCQHMCLCKSCSDYIRTREQNRSYKCPICRKRISRFMRILPGQEAAEEEIEAASEEP